MDMSSIDLEYASIYFELLIVGIPVSIILLRMMPVKPFLGKLFFYLITCSFLYLPKIAIFFVWTASDYDKYKYGKYLYDSEKAFYVFQASLLYPLSNFYLKSLVKKRRGTGFVKKKYAEQKEAWHLKELQECNNEVDLNQCEKVGSRLIKEGKDREGADYIARACLASSDKDYGDVCQSASSIFYKLGSLKKSALLLKHGCFNLNDKTSCYVGGHSSDDHEEKIEFFSEGCTLGDCRSCSEVAEIYVNNKEFLESVPFAEKSCLWECKMSCEAYSRYNILRDSADRSNR
jgi:hypothetical protein